MYVEILLTEFDVDGDGLLVSDVARGERQQRVLEAQHDRLGVVPLVLRQHKLRTRDHVTAWQHKIQRSRHGLATQNTRTALKPAVFKSLLIPMSSLHKLMLIIKW